MSFVRHSWRNGILRFLTASSNTLTLLDCGQLEQIQKPIACELSNDMATLTIPKTMRALIHNQKLQTLKLIKNSPLPVPSGNEILLKVSAAAITNGELDWPRPPELNESNPGTDMAGIVVSAPASSKFQPGDKVYMRTQYPRAGSAREFSIGLETELALRPKNVSAEEAAAVPVSALTAWQALFVHAGLQRPSYQINGVGTHPQVRVLVNGASGAVGLWMTQLAKMAGCYVIGTCTRKNTALVKGMGADELVDYTSISQWAKANGKVDIVLDCVGGKSLEDAWHAAQDNGKVFTIVPAADMVWRWDLTPPEGVSKTVVGKFFIMDTNGEHLSQITKLIEQGKARPVVDSVHRLEDYEKAFERMRSRRAVGKIVLKVADSE